MEYYTEVLEAFADTEALTVLTVAGASVSDVAVALGLELGQAVDPDEATDFESWTAWALLEVPGGVLAVEHSGFGDPTVSALAALSAGGGASALTRGNVLAHLRFGCARDGGLLFDDDEYMYIADPGVVPAELRPLFDLAWDDLSSETSDDEWVDPFAVGMAMAELVTGLEVTAAQVRAVLGSDYFRAATMHYPED